VFNKDLDYSLSFELTAISILALQAALESFARG